MTLDNIKEAILESKSIVILTHDVPDGDAIGSSLSMYLGLKQLGKEADVIIPKYSKTFSTLPEIDKVKKEGRTENYDLAIALDCGDIKRLNGFANYFEDAKTRISIDHHGINTMFGDYNFVDPTAPACCQILITVLKFLNIKITKEIGTCLLTGIITDTGGFQYQATRPETFEFAARLLKSGINVSEIYKKAMNTKTRENFELRKRAIEEVKATQDDLEGIVEEGRNIQGVEVSIFIKEKEKGYKASLRSNEYVNVSDVCLIFGGGGHKHAAGCTVTTMQLEQLKEKIINQIKMQLK